MTFYSEEDLKEIFKEKEKRRLSEYMAGSEQAFKFLKDKYPNLVMDGIVVKVYEKIEEMVNKISELEHTVSLDLSAIVKKELVNQGITTT